MPSAARLIPSIDRPRVRRKARARRRARRLYWQQTAADAEGHITQETYGNGTISTSNHHA